MKTQRSSLARMLIGFAARSRREERKAQSQLRRAMRLDIPRSVELFAGSVDYWRRKRAADLADLNRAARNSLGLVAS